MNSDKARRLVALFLACLLGGFSLSSCAAQGALKTGKLELVTRTGASVVITAEIARTDAEQEKGYMGRKVIPDGTGMLFVYTSDRMLYFWMKNTPHPLSIAYIDSQGVIREIHDMTPFSEATVASSRSLRYALEVPRGWFGRAGIAVGDRVGPASLDKALGQGR